HQQCGREGQAQETEHRGAHGSILRSRFIRNGSEIGKVRESRSPVKKNAESSALPCKCGRRSFQVLSDTALGDAKRSRRYTGESGAQVVYTCPIKMTEELHSRHRS